MDPMRKVLEATDEPHHETHNDAGVDGLCAHQYRCAMINIPSDDKETYNGIPTDEVKSLWRAALQQRHKKPEPGDVIRATGTELDESIVAAILEGALRLLPVDKSASGNQIRQEMMKLKHDQALAAERSFVDQVRARFPSIKDESEQKEMIKIAIEQGRMDVVKATPDVLFAMPQQLLGMDCCWIEYKNMFGFRKNPFVHPKHVKQYRRYRCSLGEGIVVYRLGYECQLLTIEGVQCVREAEFLAWIAAL